MFRTLSCISIACSFTAACALDESPTGPAPRASASTAAKNAVRVDIVATGFDHPWALAFLPDGRMLVTERPGRLRVVDKNGTVSAPLAGLPEVYAHNQGGMLDVAASPRFAEDSLIYLSFSEPAPDRKLSGTAVVRGKLTPNALEDVQVIWRQTPKVDSGNHWGSRLVFRLDGTLFVTLGDRYNQRPLVQDLSTTVGKIVRINADGSAPGDNPFVSRPGVRPEIWSYGHRNVQAAALDPQTGQLWTVEHGARGGDELNHPEAGKNYGWPIITYGVDYSGVKIGEGTAKEGMEQPVYYWDPVIAPSGMMFYTGNAFPDWKGNIFIGGLGSQALVRLKMANGKVVQEERHLSKLGERIRDVRQGPDGFIYVVTDSDNGRVLRLSPRR